MSSYSKRLERGQDNWEKSKGEKDFGDSPVKTGRYKMQVKDLFMDESSNGNLMIVREHTIIEGEFENEDLRDYMMLESDRGPGFIRRWIERLGYGAPTRLKDVEGVVKQIVKDAPVCIGHVRVRDEGINVRILRRLEDEEGGDKPSGDAPSGDGSDLKELVALAKKYGMDLEDDGNLDSVTDNIVKDYDHEASEYTDDEVELLQSIGAEVKGAKKKKKGADTDEQKTRLITFCQSNDTKIGEDADGKGGEDVNEDHSKDDIIKAIKENLYEEGDLDKAELELLEEVGAGDSIERPAKSKKKKKR